MRKTETQFCRWKSTDNNDINIFLSLENPCTFLLAKEKTWKRIFNTNSELSQNRTKKQIMPSKTRVNWLFNDIWCYLFIACFDWKIGIFQQTFVRIYYILNISFILTDYIIIYIYLNKACRPDYHHSGFVATGVLGHTHIFLVCWDLSTLCFLSPHSSCMYGRGLIRKLCYINQKQ